MTRLTTIHYYLPLTLEAGRYVEAPEARDPGFLLAEVSKMKDYIEAHFVRAMREVFLRGRIFTAEVYISEDPEECAYVVIDDEGKPVVVANEDDNQHRTTFRDRSGWSREYAIRLREVVGESEAFVPSESRYIWSQFVEPSFERAPAPFERGRARMSWRQVQDQSRAVILGPAGSGKTTCLRRIALEIADSLEKSDTLDTIPVYVSLRHWTVRHSLIAVVEQSLRQIGGQIVADRMNDLLSTGAICLLLDGLDEMPSGLRENATDAIEEFSTTFRRPRIFLTCRETSYEKPLRGFSHLRLRPLSIDKTIELCAYSLHGRRSWRKFSEALSVARPMKDLARNPLALSVLTEVYARTNTLPSHRAQVLDRIVKLLIEDWDRVRGVRRGEEDSVRPYERLRLLTKVAYFCTEKGKTSFSKQDFLSAARGVATEEDLSRALVVLVDHTNMIQPRGATRFSIRHHVLQEYLAALHLVNSTESIENLLPGGEWEVSWRDVWLQACGLSTEATHLFRFVLDSEGIQEIKKAELLALGLSQPIDLTFAALEEAVALIGTVLEKWLADASIVHSEGFEEARAGYFKEQDSELVLEGVFGSTIPDRREHRVRLLRLLKALQELRLGEFGQRTYHYLGRSDFEPVAVIGEYLSLEGKSEFRFRGRDRGCRLSVSRAADS